MKQTELQGRPDSTLQESEVLAFDFIPLPNRTRKPRNVGATMVLDKGLSSVEARELAAIAGNYIDFIKLGWGTARLLSRSFVSEKIETYRASHIHVSPGGTFLEIAAAHDMEKIFLREAKELGFSCIEVSDGVLPLEGRKLDLIRRATDMGFTVLSEVGRKSEIEDARYDVERRIHETLRELESGAHKVIMEGRESGTVGIFNADGGVRSDLVERIVNGVGLPNIIFEAPHKHQQVWLVSNYGNHVNLGNITPADVIAVETLRTGLRGDTMLQFHVDPTVVTIALGPEGALQAARREEVVVVIDVLRASSTIVTALAHGIRSVVPVTSVEECVGEVTAGERGGKKVGGLMHDNSPLAFTNSSYSGKELVLTTTNGTECIRAAGSESGATVAIGSLLNARAVAHWAHREARKKGGRITLLIAGRNNRVASEDVIAATEIAAYLPTCHLSGDIELIYSDDWERDFLASESGANLVALGRREDVQFCAHKDVYDVVPIWKDGRLVPA